MHCHPDLACRAATKAALMLNLQAIPSASTTEPSSSRPAPVTFRPRWPAGRRRGWPRSGAAGTAASPRVRWGGGGPAQEQHPGDQLEYCSACSASAACLGLLHGRRAGTSFARHARLLVLWPRALLVVRLAGLSTAWLAGCRCAAVCRASQTSTWCPPAPADGAFHPHEPGSSSKGGAGRPVLPGGGGGSGPRWVGVPSNNAIMQHLAAELQAAGRQRHGAQGRPPFELLSGCAVQSADRVGGGGSGSGGARWQLRGSRAGRAAAAAPSPAPEEQQDLGSYDAVVLADAMPLVPGSAGHVRGLEAASSSVAQLARSVQAVAAQPRFALMVAFHQPLRGVPFDFASVEHSSSSDDGGTGGGGKSCGSCGCGSCGTGSGGAFALVACNSSKPGRPGSGGGGSPGGSSSGDALECWVATSTAQRARQLLDQYPLVSPDGRHNPQTQQYRAAVAEELLADFRDLMAPFVQVGGLCVWGEVGWVRWEAGWKAGDGEGGALLSVVVSQGLPGAGLPPGTSLLPCAHPNSRRKARHGVQQAC